MAHQTRWLTGWLRSYAIFVSTIVYDLQNAWIWTLHTNSSGRSIIDAHQFFLNFWYFYEKIDIFGKSEFLGSTKGISFKLCTGVCSAKHPCTCPIVATRRHLRSDARHQLTVLRHRLITTSGIRCRWSDDVQMICEIPLSAQQPLDDRWWHTVLFSAYQHV